MRRSDKDASRQSRDNTRSGVLPTRDVLTTWPPGYSAALQPISAAAIAPLLHRPVHELNSNHRTLPCESNSPPDECLLLEGGLIPNRFMRRHTVIGWISNCRAARV